MSEPWSDHDDALAALVEARHLGVSSDPLVTEHLDGCPGCQREWSSLNDTIARLEAAREVLPGGARPTAILRERTRRAIGPDSRAKRARDPRVGGRRFGWAALGAMAGATVMAGVFAMFPTVRPIAAETFDLVGGSSARDITATVEIRQVSPDAVTMRLVADNLPASEPGELYELWWVGPDKRHLACGTFRSDGSPIDLTFTSAPNLSETVLIEITLESDDGDTAPGPHVAQSRPRDAGSTWTPAP
ncbi:MAG: anti-sigma factor [Candidatus Limnocylindria bacterium]